MNIIARQNTRRCVSSSSERVIAFGVHGAAAVLPCVFCVSKHKAAAAKDEASAEKTRLAAERREFDRECAELGAALESGKVELETRKRRYDKLEAEWGNTATKAEKASARPSQTDWAMWVTFSIIITATIAALVAVIVVSVMAEGTANE